MAADGIFIEHSGKKVWYPLTKDPQSGLFVYRPGLAPDLSPQVNQSNYNYGSIPPSVAVIRAWEDWHAGGGFEKGGENPTHEGHGGHRYNFARGVDASWGGLRLSIAMTALLESDSTAIAAAPAFYSRTSDGTFVVAGSVIYEYDSGGWLARKTLAGTGTGPIVDFNGTQFAPCGSSAYAFSSDGVTWTDVAAPLADLNAQFFAVRGQTSGAAVLWKITSTGALKNNTSGESGGAAWSAATQIGGSGETVNGLSVMDGDIIITKTDGIYTFDGTTVSKVWDGGRLMFRSNNGANPTIWSDGNLYTTYGDTLIQYDNVNTAVSFIWPREGNLGNDELNGQITAICASVTHIFFALKNSAGNTYIMKGTPADGFHPVHYLGANNCNALYMVGPGDVAASNPCLMIGYGTAGNYFLYPRAGLLPEDDANVTFLTTGYIIGSLDGVNAKGFTKFLNSGLVLGKSLATGKTVELLYEDDENGTYTTILTADSDGVTEKDVAQEVEFNLIRYKAILMAPTSADTPIAESLVFSTTPNNPRRLSWAFSVDIGEVTANSGGGTPRLSSPQMESHLLASAEKRVNLYDIHGTKRRVRILDVEGQGHTLESSGKPKQAFAVSAVEI